MARPTYRWKFARTGGFDQATIASGDDIARLESLDQKLWVALAMPTDGVDVDPKTLAVLDSDKDGRVRAPEILAAARWACDALESPDELVRGGEALKVAAIKAGPLRAAAERILTSLGRPGSDTITLADVADTNKIFAETRFNGDGVVPADAAEDADTRQVIEEIITLQGSLLDKSGKPGIDQARADAFFTQAEALVAWADAPAATVAAFGARTAEAADAVRAVRAKVDDYFTRCNLAVFDARAATLLSGAETDLAALGAHELSTASAEVARLPLARIEAKRPLPLADGVNPAWAGPLATVAASAVTPLLGARNALSEAEWKSLTEALAPHEAWRAQKPAGTVETLALDRVRAIVAGGARARVNELLGRDLALAEETQEVASVEKLLLLHRDLFRVLRNFVNFSDFYARKGGLFQAGTLYLDGRSCDLCLRVTDAGKHATLASLAATYLAYCDCTRAGGEKMTIVAAFTGGDSDNLIVGRNGVFYDRKGRDWDATIVKIVANPISLREAFWSPYKKLSRLIEEQVTKRAAASEAASDERLKGVATATAQADQTKPPPKPEPARIDVGTVAAIGVAIGGIGAMVTGVLSAFFGLGAWMPIGLVAVVLMISGPAMLLAYVKLRRRNLGPLLDASGWAINARACINVPFGGALTSLPA
ncbi:MAG TPA: hypothetical protein VF334_02430, partial [Polyangia bacterium]